MQPSHVEGAVQVIRVAGLEGLLTALAVIFATSVLVFATFSYFAVRTQTKLLAEIRDVLKENGPPKA